jgi:DNA-binding MarR family transcriptional regulator
VRQRSNRRPAATADRPAPGGDHVAERLHAAAIHLLRRLRRQDGAMGLSPARASALSIMVFGGRVTIGRLAQAEQVSAPTMTRLVVGMERDGLVRRESDPNDGRVVWLEATAKGRSILHAGRERRVAALAEDLAGLEESERETLAAAVVILERMVGRPGEAVGAGEPEEQAGEAGPAKARRKEPNASAARRRIG